MYINFNTSLIFKRRLKSAEEAEYFDVYKKGRALISHSDYTKDVLIVPVSSLPQNDLNNTGVGNLLSDESASFFHFAKKYWGVNEIQLLPVGQYHNSSGQYPLYSGTTMDFGNHMISVKSVLPSEDYEKLVKENFVKNVVNFSNVVDKNSNQEDLLKKVYKNLSGELKSEFENYKNINKDRHTPKSVFTILADKYASVDYKNWTNTDANLYDDRIVTISERNKRISELLKSNCEAADYYVFKQFLAEKTLSKAKSNLNKIGLKLNGDVPCGFSSDEVWANPKAFLKDSTIGWGMPALDFTTPEAETLLRKKIKFYSEFFDGFRIDAAWMYAEPRIKNLKSGQISTQYFGDKFLKLIEDEAQKVKGGEFDLKNISYEFAAAPEVYNIFNGSSLKPYVEDRVKLYTSDYLSEDWGMAKAYLDRGWKSDAFMLGAANHDSKEIVYNEKQAKILSDVLKIPAKKLKSYGEFLNAKFAEPLRGKNNMIFFMHALGMKGQFKGNVELSKNYTSKIPANFEDFYVNALKNNEAYNPMYGLEMQFISQGLDKSNPQLFKKIQKYRKILQQNSGDKVKIYIYASILAALLLTVGGLYLLRQNKSISNQHQ